MRCSYVVPMRWMVIRVYEYEVPGGALNLNSTKLPRQWSPRGSFPSRKNPHGRTGNRTQDLMISSQKFWLPDHEAGQVIKRNEQNSFCCCNIIWNVFSLTFNYHMMGNITHRIMAFINRWFCRLYIAAVTTYVIYNTLNGTDEEKCNGMQSSRIFRAKVYITSNVTKFYGLFDFTIDEILKALYKLIPAYLTYYKIFSVNATPLFWEPNVIFVATDRNIEIVSIVIDITFQPH
jgi:hypothetical protein